jgi:PAS domain S-box-containing protein
VLSRRWMYVMVAALLADLLLSGAPRLASLQHFLAGGRDAGALLGMADLVAVTVGVLAGLVGAHSFLTAGTELDRRGQVIAAAATLTPDWLWETDLEGRFTYCSEGVEQLLGYDPDSLVGMLSTDLLYDADQRETAFRLLDDSRHHGFGWASVPAVWRHLDGTPVTLRGAAVPIHQRGRVVGYRGTRGPVVAETDAQRVLCAAQSRISQVLATDAFEIALQPLVCLTTGKVVGVEALARFDDGRGPDLWFRDAYDCGRSLDLEARTFAAALELFDAIPDPVYLSVNASPQLLMDARFRQALRESSAPMHQLVIEITEHARVSDYAELSAAVDTLRELGVRFAIDDTGAGYASLNHVLQLRPDMIKLDRALIAHLNDDRARRSLVTALVLLALDIGASVTGEGVETISQIDTLTTLGVDTAQGYVLAKPTTDGAEWSQWWDRVWTVVPLQLPTGLTGLTEPTGGASA